CACGTTSSGRGRARRGSIASKRARKARRRGSAASTRRRRAKEADPMWRSWLAPLAALMLLASAASADVIHRAYPVPAGGHPHDVAVGADGIVWYTAHRSVHLGRLGRTTG